MGDTKRSDVKIRISTKEHEKIGTKESVEMINLESGTPRVGGSSVSPVTSRRKSMFYNTIRYFRQEDIARRFVELFPPFGFAEVFVIFFLVLMLSVSFLSAMGKLNPMWASYASWSPAFVVFFGAFGLRNNTVGMILVFAGIGIGIWAIVDEDHSDMYFEHGTQAGVLIFVAIGSGWLMRILIITSHHCGKRREGRSYLDYAKGKTSLTSCITDIITSDTAHELLEDGDWCRHIAGVPKSPRSQKIESKFSSTSTATTTSPSLTDDALPPGIPPLLQKHFTELDRSGLIETCKRVRRKTISKTSSSPLLLDELKVDEEKKLENDEVLVPDETMSSTDTTTLEHHEENSKEHPDVSNIFQHEDGRLGIMNENVGFINLPGRTVSCGSVKNGFFPPLRMWEILPIILIFGCLVVMLSNIIFDLDLQSNTIEIKEGGNYFETFMRGAHFFALVLSICRFDPTYLMWTILLCVSLFFQVLFLLLFALSAIDYGEIKPYDMTAFGVCVLCTIWLARCVASFKPYVLLLVFVVVVVLYLSNTPMYLQVLLRTIHDAWRTKRGRYVVQYI